MDLLIDFARTFVGQLQTPTLSFLLGGLVLASLGSRLAIPDPIYRFVVFMLLMRIGLEGGMEIRHADLTDMLLPAIIAVVVGCVIVLLGRVTLARMPGVVPADGIATAGLFGAVSASTLAAAMAVLEESEVSFEAWVPALYPFMDIPALVVAIVLARVHEQRRHGRAEGRARGTRIRAILADSLRGSALSALMLGVLLGLVAQPQSAFASFYDPLFPGLLSVLMLILGIEAHARLTELKSVAHWYVVYAIVAPLAHGLLAFALGTIAHWLTGFSPGGVILMAVIASSNSDISGPPTLRAGIPSANPSAYIGTSTGIGTPMAIAVGIPLYLALGRMVFGI